MALWPRHVRFGSKADMCSAKGHVRFTPESGHFEPAIAACIRFGTNSPILVFNCVSRGELVVIQPMGMR